MLMSDGRMHIHVQTYRTVSLYPAKPEAGTTKKYREKLAELQHVQTLIRLLLKETV